MLSLEIHNRLKGHLMRLSSSLLLSVFVSFSLNAFGVSLREATRAKTLTDKLAAEAQQNLDKAVEMASRDKVRGEGVKDRVKQAEERIAELTKAHEKVRAIHAAIKTAVEKGYKHAGLRVGEDLTSHVDAVRQAAKAVQDTLKAFRKADKTKAARPRLERDIRRLVGGSASAWLSAEEAELGQDEVSDAGEDEVGTGAGTEWDEASSVDEHEAEADADRAWDLGDQDVDAPWDAAAAAAWSSLESDRRS